MNGEIELEETGLANLTDTHPLLENQQNANHDDDDDGLEAGESIITCRICLECDGHEGFVFLFLCFCFIS